MKLIQVDYRKVKSQYNLFLDRLRYLENDRVLFNINLVKELSKKYFGNEIEIITYTDKEGIDCYGDDEYIFKIRILSKTFIQSNGNQRLDSNTIDKIKEDLRENLIYNYKTENLQILIDEDYNGEDDLKYFDNIL